MDRWKEVVLITLIIRSILFIINPSSDDWVRWDGPHYVDIAKNWYQTSGDPLNFIVFYPLYPLLIKTVSLFTGNFNMSAVLISLIFSVLSSILLFELALIDFNKKIGILSVWFLNIFPTSFFLQAGYTESLFLTLSLFSVYLYRKKYFMLSGFYGLFSSITRVNGLTLIPFYLFEEFPNKFSMKKLTPLITVCLLTLIGFSIYSFINYLKFGDFFYFTTPLSEHWYKSFKFPWIGIKSLIDFTASQQGNYYYLFIGEIAAIIFTYLLTIYTIFKIRLSYGIYMLVNLLLFTSTSYIMSTPRYILILFPIYFCLAKIQNKVLLSLISLLFITLLIRLSQLYTEGNWAY